MFEKVLTIFVICAAAVALFWILTFGTEIPVDNNSVWIGVCIIAAGAIIQKESKK